RQRVTAPVVRIEGVDPEVVRARGQVADGERLWIVALPVVRAGGALLAGAAALVEVNRGVVAGGRVDGDVEAVPDAELEPVDEVGARGIHVGRAERRDGVAVVHVAGRVAGVVERQRGDRSGGGAGL